MIKNFIEISWELKETIFHNMWTIPQEVSV